MASNIFRMPQAPNGEFVPVHDWPTIIAEILIGVREGRSVRAIVREKADIWPGYSAVLQKLIHEHGEEYHAAKRDGAEALGDDTLDVLQSLRTGEGDPKAARVFLEGAARRMGQMNSEYNDRRWVHHRHTVAVDDKLRKRLDAAEARVKALECATVIDAEATEIDD